MLAACNRATHADNLGLSQRVEDLAIEEFIAQSRVSEGTFRRAAFEHGGNASYPDHGEGNLNSRCHSPTVDPI
jgi:hypothetical protein